MSDAPETYTVRSIWEGELLSEVTGLDEEDANRVYAEKHRYYLNLPNSESAEGITVGIIRESDDWVMEEITFYTPNLIDQMTEAQFHAG